MSVLAEDFEQKMIISRQEVEAEHLPSKNNILEVMEGIESQIFLDLIEENARLEEQLKQLHDKQISEIRGETESETQTETGKHQNMLNIPIQANTDGFTFRTKFDEIILPRLDAYKPEILLISAGFDAHYKDPLANIDLRTEDYEWITHKLCDIADKHADGRVISSLEGGYDLAALAESVAIHVKVLMERSK